MRKIVLLLTCLVMTTLVLAQTTYTTIRNSRVRSEPNTSASIITTLSAGTTITALETVEGAAVSGSRVWYRIRVNGQTGYIHSSLVTTAAVDNSGSSGDANPPALGSGNTSLATVEAVVPVTTGVTCGGANTCGQMNSCEQAYACLNAGM